MEMWHIWAIVAAVMVAVEIFTAGFAAICLAIGAAASAVVAGMGFGLKAQIIWFAVFTLFSFVVVRPIVRKTFFRKNKTVRKSGIDALVGRIGVVSETIDASANTGRVAIDGDDWKAVADTDGAVIGKGEQVEVLGVDSIVLTVRKK